MVVTRVGRRGLDPAAVVAAIAGRVPTEAIPDPRAAVLGARAGTPADGAVLVAGSLFLVGEAYAAVRGIDALLPAWQGWDRIGTQARP